MANYGLDTGTGDAVTTGLQEHEARRVAQRIANERGETLYLYALAEGDGEAGESEAIVPRSIITTVRVSATEIRAELGERSVVVAVHSSDESTNHLTAARALRAQMGLTGGLHGQGPEAGRMTWSLGWVR